MAQRRCPRHRHLVHRTDRLGIRTVARRDLVRLRERTDLPVPDTPLVPPGVHLDALPLAGIAHRAESGAHPSGPGRWPGLSGQFGLRLHAAGPGLRRPVGRDAGEPDLLRRRHAARVQGRDRLGGDLRRVPGAGPAIRVLEPTCQHEAHRPARIRRSGDDLRARVRQQMAAR
ncbi:hypothetical protein D3C75_899790 [compost metagenome]